MTLRPSTVGMDIARAYVDGPHRSMADGRKASLPSSFASSLLSGTSGELSTLNESLSLNQSRISCLFNAVTSFALDNVYSSTARRRKSAKEQQQKCQQVERVQPFLEEAAKIYCE